MASKVKKSKINFKGKTVSIGSIASAQALREPLFLQFFLNSESSLFQGIRRLYVFPRS